MLTKFRFNNEILVTRGKGTLHKLSFKAYGCVIAVLFKPIRNSLKLAIRSFYSTLHENL